MKTFFISVYSSIARMPSSRPTPDMPYPPNGASTCTELFELTLTTPARSARVTLLPGYSPAR